MNPRLKEELDNGQVRPSIRVIVNIPHSRKSKENLLLVRGAGYA